VRFNQKKLTSKIMASSGITISYDQIKVTGAFLGGCALTAALYNLYTLKSQRSKEVTSVVLNPVGEEEEQKTLVQRRKSFASRRSFSAGATGVIAQIEKTLRPDAVVVVDPVSTGANLASEFMSRGIRCIRVFSRYVPPSLVGMVAPNLRSDFAATIYHDNANFEHTIEELEALPYNITAVIAGSELGTELTDALGYQLGVFHNTPETSFLRRDKFQMGEAVRRSRVRAVKQARVQNKDQVENFLRQLKPEPFRVVIKPISSAGSDNVYLCRSKEELMMRFDQIIGGTNQLNLPNHAVVVQEYLEGREYVVDTVSLDGKHKLCAIWMYDKRSANGAAFVYYGMQMLQPEDPLCSELFIYQQAVLDALGIHHGPAHAEIIVTKDGPVLVECGARPHGAEGTFIPISDRCFGRNQVSMTVDAFCDEKAFLEHPDQPPQSLQFGLKIDFVSYVSGKLVAMPHLDTIRKLPSFVSFELMPEIGSTIRPTIDCFTAVGSCTLIHANKEQVLADHEVIRKLESTKEFFTVTQAASP